MSQGSRNWRGVEGHARKCEVGGVTVGSLAYSSGRPGLKVQRPHATVGKSGHTAPNRPGYDGGTALTAEVSKPESSPAASSLSLSDGPSRQGVIGR